MTTWQTASGEEDCVKAPEQPQWNKWWDWMNFQSQILDELSVSLHSFRVWFVQCWLLLCLWFLQLTSAGMTHLVKRASLLFVPKNPDDSQAEEPAGYTNTGWCVFVWMCDAPVFLPSFSYIYYIYLISFLSLSCYLRNEAMSDINRSWIVSCAFNKNRLNVSWKENLILQSELFFLLLCKIKNLKHWNTLVCVISPVFIRDVLSQSSGMIHCFNQYH